jgi:hypothetical protein
MRVRVACNAPYQTLSFQNDEWRYLRSTGAEGEMRPPLRGSS